MKVTISLSGSRASQRRAEISVPTLAGSLCRERGQWALRVSWSSCQQIGSKDFTACFIA